MDILTEILYPAVDEAKESIESAAELSRAPDAVLFGEGGLDSLGLVRFIVMVEERVEDATQVSLRLASEKTMSLRSSPFRTLATLAEHIRQSLKDEGWDG